MNYNGRSWETVGTRGISAAGIQNGSIAIAPNGIPVVAFAEYGSSSKATVLKYSPDGDTPLPVELSSFTATVIHNNATLSWRTAPKQIISDLILRKKG